MIAEKLDTGKLVEDCLKGERIAFSKLYAMYSRQMYSVALRMLKDKEEAEDILQESFSDAFANLQSFRSDATFGSWLKRIVVNKSLNRLKKKQLNLVEITSDKVMEEPEEAAYPKLSVSQVQEAMNQLSDGFRVVLTLYLFEGYTHKEISDSLGISQGTSKSQYMRAKERLRQLLVEQYGDK